MKRALLVSFLFLLSISSFGKTDLEDKFKSLFYDDNNYEEIIKYKPKAGEFLSAKALYYIGLSYLMTYQDDEALKYLDKAIKKGPADPNMYYHKGNILSYKKHYDEALANYKEANKMFSFEPDYLSAMGETYKNLGQTDSAIIYLEKAAWLPTCDTRTFLLLGGSYSIKDEYEKAIQMYETALKIMKEREKKLYYQTTLYNLGLSYQTLGYFQKGLETFLEIITKYPDDFESMAKIIQMLYALEQYEEAKPYKEALYKAHENKKLPKFMKDMFCFDQFNWNGKKITAYEVFDERNGFISVKHHFYVLNENEEIECRIDSESSTAVRIHDAKLKYVLSLNKNNTHSTFWDYVFDENYDYKELKAAVINILEDKVKPLSSSSYKEDSE